MNILIFTRSEWSNENSTGNTLSNFFGGFSKTNIANIYMRDAMPDNKICTNFFSISDKQILKSLLNRKFIPGRHFYYENVSKYCHNEETSLETKLYKKFRVHNSTIPLLLQNALWNSNKWKNKNLDQFLEDFKPDIIFSPSFHTTYTHKILWYIQKKTSAKLVLFHADDYLKKEGENMMERQFYKKRKEVILKSINLASLNYCISKEQQNEYENKLNKNMKLLYKGADFREAPDYNISVQNSIKIIYIGSLYYGRWKTLAKLANNIKKVNEKSDVKFVLNIYSQYKPDEKILNSIEIKGTSKFKGKIPNDIVSKVMKEADIVLHVESFEEKEKKITRLSFSTKIVDCLNSGRTLMAIGDEKLASINYLSENDAAIVINSEDRIEKKLLEIQKDTSILSKYALKSWEQGEKNHNINTIRREFYNDLVNLYEDVN
ncbi:glycosyltransferase family protein [Staphylococcus equorum]|uniref:hypothetical protein n=1 Tax=Staphylococcus equorum TaxID=246432 RepID=UPI0020CD2024|nr:hypothetical protein [Staphylococcus equorum]MEB7715531.1 hypothetical protein [Staphylococcus equorum]MEB7759886.1 hypothetical protein [Staphylococcus equorum]MEB7762361.1 hypothetical protein [Staphylococcus equorum]MEB7793473.1 hypothetical protein [Staphylococcus equorum]UTT55869.1 hypothetical protein NMQ06_12220 [Staphylococcus equorum]